MTRNITKTAAALTTAAALATLVLANFLMARRAERRHPPGGSFLTIEGVKLHYSDRGRGSPVVLIHGNAVSGDDWDISGVADLLLRNHRVITFDRPGFGYSERPIGSLWTARRQAHVIGLALAHLGIERPAVVGQSWGTLVALELALQPGADLAGLVLVSGYYFPTWRPDALIAAIGALPLIGDLMRYTISPLLGLLQMPLQKWAMFSPAPVTDQFRTQYSDRMALRPTQLRATSQDGALMIPCAAAMQRHYQHLTLPVRILAGAGDKIVFKKNSERLAGAIPDGTLRIISGAGHMLHHTDPVAVVEAVNSLSKTVSLVPAA